MPNVEFDENNFPSSNFQSQSNSTPALVGLIMKLGMAKTEQQANYVLITIAVCAFAATIYVIVKML
jgi:hypothetical protein